jgi:hypothetical protein
MCNSAEMLPVNRMSIVRRSTMLVRLSSVVPGMLLRPMGHRWQYNVMTYETSALYNQLHGVTHLYFRWSVIPTELLPVEDAFCSYCEARKTSLYRGCWTYPTSYCNNWTQNKKLGVKEGMFCSISNCLTHVRVESDSAVMLV